MEHLRGVWLVLQVCVWYAGGTTFYQYPTSCAPRNTIQKDPGVFEDLPPFPKLPDTFQVHVEANFLNVNKTVQADEYFDGPGNRAAMRLSVKDKRDLMIFDIANSQLFYVMPDGMCSVSDLETDDNALIFGITKGQGGMHAPSTYKVLQIAKENGLTYMGKTVVRGINVDQWRTCLYWSELSSNFTLDFFLSGPNWLTPESMASVPVRAEVRGLLSNQVTGDKTFHHMYEYIDFRPLPDSDRSVFETPEGVVCEGRKHTKPVPTLPPAFSYSEEISTPYSNVIFKTNVWYDFTKKLVKYEQPGQAREDYKLLQVHDFNTGIAYVWNHQTNNCTITPITNSSFESRTASLDGKVFEMKTPADIFFLDDTFVYSGQRKCRDMTCNVYSGKLRNFPYTVGGKMVYTNATMETYFLSYDWSNDTVPVQAKLTNMKVGGLTFNYNMYNFIAEPQNISNFDITKCFKEDRKLDVKIDFDSGSENSGIKQDIIVEKISHLTNLQPIRIQKPEIHFDSNRAYFTATLLDTPPSVGQTFRPVLEMTLSQALDLLQDSVTKAEFQISGNTNQNYTALSMSVLSKEWQISAERKSSVGGGSDLVGR